MSSRFAIRRIDVGQRTLEIERFVERGTVDLGIGLEQCSEIAAFVPCLHRISLHDPVRVVTAQTTLTSASSTG